MLDAGGRGRERRGERLPGASILFVHWLESCAGDEERGERGEAARRRSEREAGGGDPLQLQRPNNYAIHSRCEAVFVLVASRVSPVVVAIISLFR